MFKSNFFKSLVLAIATVTLLTWTAYDYAGSQAKWEKYQSDTDQKVVTIKGLIKDLRDKSNASEEELKEEIADLEKEIAELQGTISDMESDGNVFNEKYTALIKEYDSLGQKYNELVSEYNSLKEYTDQVQTEYDDKGNEDLDEILDYLNGEVSDEEEGTSGDVDPAEPFPGN